VSGKHTEWFYTEFSLPLRIHPAYLSMFCLLATACSLHLLRKGQLRLSFATVMIAVLIAGLLLLSSRNQWVALLVLGICGSVIIAVRKRKILLAAAIPLTIVLLLATAYLKLERPKQRMDRAWLEMKLLFEPIDRMHLDSRNQMWAASIQVVSTYPLTGVGTGDMSHAIQEVYESRGFVIPLKKNLNSHNQFLQTAVALGIPGMLLLLAGLLIPFLLALKNGHLLYPAFLLMVMLAMLTESMLETASGVVFYSFFQSLMAKHALR
jgi:O-antigen ligase